MSNLNIIVVGGGLAGLTASLALQSFGFDVTILESKKKKEEIHAGVQISPNATVVLNKLGLKSNIDKIANVPQNLQLRNWENGETIFNQSFKSMLESKSSSYLLINRYDLLNILQKKFGEKKIIYGATCKKINLKNNKVTLTTKNKKVFTADLVIAADGMNSLIKDKYFIKSPPIFSGIFCFRGSFPISRIKKLKIKNNVMVWLGPNKHFVNYLISSGKKINIVGFLQNKKLLNASYKENMKKLFYREFTNWHMTPKSLINSSDNIIGYPIYFCKPLPFWFKKKIVLLGDAAHGILPFQAQGLSQSIEDSYVLAKCLAFNTGSLSVALKDYEIKRKNRLKIIEKISFNNKKIFHFKSSILTNIRDFTLKKIQNSSKIGIKGMQNWIYGYDVTK
jgi:salicylate hydroxylase